MQHFSVFVQKWNESFSLYRTGVFSVIFRHQREVKVERLHTIDEIKYPDSIKNLYYIENILKSFVSELKHQIFLRISSIILTYFVAFVGL